MVKSPEQVCQIGAATVNSGVSCVDQVTKQVIPASERLDSNANSRARGVDYPRQPARLALREIVAPVGDRESMRGGDATPLSLRIRKSHPSSQSMSGLGQSRF